MLDILGCPITVGCTILTTGYLSSAFDTIMVVEKVNKKSVNVVLKACRYGYNETTRKYEPKVEYKTMRRTSKQIVVIDQQIAYIQEHFPENLL